MQKLVMLLCDGNEKMRYLFLISKPGAERGGVDKNNNTRMDSTANKIEDKESFHQVI